MSLAGNQSEFLEKVWLFYKYHEVDTRDGPKPVGASRVHCLAKHGTGRFCIQGFGASGPAVQNINNKGRLSLIRVAVSNRET